MCSPEELFQARWALDCRRQSARADALREVDKKMREMLPGVTHPYALGFAEKKHLADQCPYYKGSKGKTVVPSATHLFCLTSVQKLGHLVAWKTSNDDPFDLHNKLRTEAGTPPKWLPLATYADGPLKSFREFTWWTTYDIIEAGQPFVAGRRLGLLDDWIAELAVVVRWELDANAADIQVPTCCDAYDGPVFESMDDAHDSGITIDLNTDPFQPGEPEFAVTALPVQQLSVYAVKIGSDLRERVRPASESKFTWSRLQAYYETAP